MGAPTNLVKMQRPPRGGQCGSNCFKPGYLAQVLTSATQYQHTIIITSPHVVVDKYYRDVFAAFNNWVVFLFFGQS